MNKFTKKGRCSSYFKNIQNCQNFQKENQEKKSERTSANSTCKNSFVSSHSCAPNYLSKFLLQKNNQHQKEKKVDNFPKIPKSQYNNSISRLLKNFKSDNTNVCNNASLNLPQALNQLNLKNLPNIKNYNDNYNSNHNHSVNQKKKKKSDSNFYKFYWKQNSIFYFLQNAVLNKLNKSNNSNKLNESNNSNKLNKLNKSNSTVEIKSPNNLLLTPFTNNTKSLKALELNNFSMMGNSSSSKLNNSNTNTINNLNNFNNLNNLNLNLNINYPEISILNSRNLKILEEESSQSYSNDSKEEQKGINSIKIVEDPNINSKRDFLFFSKETTPTPNNGRKYIIDKKNSKESHQETEEYPIKTFFSSLAYAIPSSTSFTTMSKLNKKYSLPNYSFYNYVIEDRKSSGFKLKESIDLLQFVKKKDYGILKTKKMSSFSNTYSLSNKHVSGANKSTLSNTCSSKEIQYLPAQNIGDQP